MPSWPPRLEGIKSHIVRDKVANGYLFFVVKIVRFKINKYYVTRINWKEN